MGWFDGENDALEVLEMVFSPATAMAGEVMSTHDEWVRAEGERERDAKNAQRRDAHKAKGKRNQKSAAQSANAAARAGTSPIVAAIAVWTRGTGSFTECKAAAWAALQGQYRTQLESAQVLIESVPATGWTQEVTGRLAGDETLKTVLYVVGGFTLWTLEGAPMFPSKAATLTGYLRSVGVV